MARRKTLGFPPRFEDLVSNFARLVTDRKAGRLNRDHRMAKNALSKFSYNRSSSQHPPLAKPENFLTDGVTRVCLSWKHDSFRRWIRQLAIARLRTCLNNNLRRFRRARKFLHQLIKVNNYFHSNSCVVKCLGTCLERTSNSNRRVLSLVITRNRDFDPIESTRLASVTP